MPTADNFVLDGSPLGGFHKAELDIKNPIDLQGNQRGLTGPLTLEAERYADHPTAEIVRAYCGSNGLSKPLAEVSFDVVDDTGVKIVHVIMKEAVVVSWGMESPEPPLPEADGTMPSIAPDIEKFTLRSTKATYSAGGIPKTFNRR